MKISRLSGASGIHTGTMGYGKMEGHGQETVLAYMLERDECMGSLLQPEMVWHETNLPNHLRWYERTASAWFLRKPRPWQRHQHLWWWCFRHIDSPAAGGKSLDQAYNCWKEGADPIEFAKTHPEFARAFDSFPGDADRSSAMTA